MAKPRCYVASPLGFTEAGRRYYADVYLPALEAVVEPVDPWALAPAGELTRDVAMEIGRRNVEAIRSCSLLLAYLEGAEPDSGTVAELGYAAALGLTCHGLRSDLRVAGEGSTAVNLQVEAFVELSGGRIHASLGAAVDALGRPS